MFVGNGLWRYDFISRLIEKSYDNKYFICICLVYIKEYWF